MLTSQKVRALTTVYGITTETATKWAEETVMPYTVWVERAVTVMERHENEYEQLRHQLFGEVLKILVLDKGNT